jgi:alanyl aminopeptidase
MLLFALTLLSSEPTIAAVRVKAEPPPAVVVDEPSPGFRLPAGEKPVSYAMQLDVDPTKDSFSGSETILVHLDAAQKTIWLHARNLTVSSAKVAGQNARFKQVDDDGMAGLFLDASVGPGDVPVEIAWSAKYNESLEGVYKVVSEDNAYIFTQFEAISARNSIPCFDEPGLKSTFSVSLNIPEGDRVAGNTREARSNEIGDGRVHVELVKTQPLPVYLLAFAVGPLDIVEGKAVPPSALRKDPIPLRGVATKGHGAQLKKSLENSAKVLTQLEKWFGIAYPFGKMDIVAVPDFAAGAMENAGLVTFRDELLLVDDKSPIDAQKWNLFVIAHEFAHQWFGDYVTLAWWDDIWLNEAFATWMETPIVDAIRPDFHAPVEMRSDNDRITGADSLVSARQIRQPVTQKGDIVNAFDGITYQKGASVIEMFASWMGRAKFQAGVRDYMKQHAFGTATGADLLAALSKAAGKDVTTPFSTFLDQPGVPFVKAAIDCSDKKAPKLTLAQERYLPLGTTGDRNKTWQIPVCARVDVAGGPTCTLFGDVSGAMPLHACPKSVHPSYDGVGYYRWSLPGDQLKATASTLKRLSAGERISFANAVRAGFGAGTVSFADALDASLPLANDDEPTLAGTPLWFLRTAFADLVEPEARPKVQAKIVEIYKPILDKLKLEGKPNEDPRVREKRSMAITALADSAEDAATLDALAKKGRAVLDLDNPDKSARKVHLEKIAPDLAGDAIAAVVERDPSTWDDVNALLSTETESQTRGYLLGALTSTHDESNTPKALALALDARLKVNELWSPIAAQAQDVRTRDAAWSWFQKNYDAVAARMPEEGRGHLARVFSSYCSEDRAQELTAFFGPKKDKTPGMERALAQALESVRLCAAKKAAHEESAKKMFPK